MKFVICWPIYFFGQYIQNIQKYTETKIKIVNLYQSAIARVSNPFYIWKKIDYVINNLITIRKLKLDS